MYVKATWDYKTTPPSKIPTGEIFGLTGRRNYWSRVFNYKGETRPMGTGVQIAPQILTRWRKK